VRLEKIVLKFETSMVKSQKPNFNISKLDIQKGNIFDCTKWGEIGRIKG